MAPNFSHGGVAYEFVKNLGSGAFGTVYLYQQSNDHSRQVVVKELEPKEPKDKEHSEREVNVLKSLKHDNVVKYIGHYEAGRKLYILMEYCNGGDLETLIESKRNPEKPEKEPEPKPEPKPKPKPDGVPKYFTEFEIFAIFSQIVDAFLFLHKNSGKQIIHRDVKAKNIFLCSPSSTEPLTPLNCVAKVGDFGVCATDEHTREISRTVVGTLAYMAPEVINEQPYGAKADIWSLGIVLYELAALHRPFEVKEAGPAALLKIARDPFQPLPPFYSKTLTDLITGMLQKDPSNRYDIDAVTKSDFMRKNKKYRTLPDRDVAQKLLSKYPAEKPYEALEAALDGPGQAPAAVVAALVEMIPPKDPTYSDWTPLHYAANSGRDDVIRLLNGINLTNNAAMGETPLIIAARLGYSEVAEALLDCGADIHIADCSGRTALHSAVSWQHINMVRLLLKRHANINAKTSDGTTPLGLAIKEGASGIAELLRSQGGLLE